MSKTLKQKQLFVGIVEKPCPKKKPWWRHPTGTVIEILGLLKVLGEILTPFLELPLIISIPFITFGIGVISAVVDNIPISAALAPVFFDLE